MVAKPPQPSMLASGSGAAHEAVHNVHLCWPWQRRTQRGGLSDRAAFYKWLSKESRTQDILMMSALLVFLVVVSSVNNTRFLAFRQSLPGHLAVPTVDPNVFASMEFLGQPWHGSLHAVGAWRGRLASSLAASMLANMGKADVAACCRAISTAIHYIMTTSSPVMTWRVGDVSVLLLQACVLAVLLLQLLAPRWAAATGARHCALAAARVSMAGGSLLGLLLGGSKFDGLLLCPYYYTAPMNRSALRFLGCWATVIGQVSGVWMCSPSVGLTISISPSSTSYSHWCSSRLLAPVTS